MIVICQDARYSLLDLGSSVTVLQEVVAVALAFCLIWCLALNREMETLRKNWSSQKRNLIAKLLARLLSFWHNFNESNQRSTRIRCIVVRAFCWKKKTWVRFQILKQNTSFIKWKQNFLEYNVQATHGIYRKVPLSKLRGILYLPVGWHVQSSLRRTVLRYLTLHCGRILSV